jgi:hypothetical protein
MWLQHGYTRDMTKTQKPHTATCTRCHATLRSEASIARGMGAHCARLHRQEQAVKNAGFKPAMIAAAREIIADGAIAPIRGRRVFEVVSSNGIDRYLTAPEACNCPAGLKSRYACYHRAAATILAA